VQRKPSEKPLRGGASHQTERRLRRWEMTDVGRGKSRILPLEKRGSRLFSCPVNVRWVGMIHGKGGEVVSFHEFEAVNGEKGSAR